MEPADGSLTCKGHWKDSRTASEKDGGEIDGSPRASGARSGSVAPTATSRRCPSCAKEGIDNARITSGLALSIVRSPAGCACFADGYPSAGGKCTSEVASCAAWSGPSDTAKLCGR
ncbi:MAG: hypothetical protein U1F43_03730 [Myxococcota bacterium]